MRQRRSRGSTFCCLVLVTGVALVGCATDKGGPAGPPPAPGEILYGEWDGPYGGVPPFDRIEIAESWDAPAGLVRGFRFRPLDRDEAVQRALKTRVMPALHSAYEDPRLREALADPKSRVHFIGHSHGAKVVTVAAALMPEPPAQVTLFDSPENLLPIIGGALKPNLSSTPDNFSCTRWSWYQGRYTYIFRVYNSTTLRFYDCKIDYSCTYARICN